MACMGLVQAVGTANSRLCPQIVGRGLQVSKVFMHVMRLNVVPVNLDLCIIILTASVRQCKH